jgi:hypothetical protein
MRKNINYNNIFNNIEISIPKSIKGDINEVKDIKIGRIYVPKSLRIKHNNGNEINKKFEINDKKPLIKANTFEDIQDEIATQKPENNQEFKYCITTKESDLIYIPDNENYKTNDKDLKQLIDLMNEPTTKDFGYTNVINEKKCKVYKRLVEGIPVILIKAMAKLPYNKDVVFEAIANLNIRKQWDSVFSELRVVNHEGENGAEILYMIIKSPVLLVKNRDFVQQRKIWRNFPTTKSHMLHFISIDSPECPINKKCIRAETVISGYYMQDDPEEPGHTLLGVLSQTDIKGDIPVFLVNKFAPKSSKSWINSLTKGCEIVLKNNK